jgi:flagellar biogenesis protein FliO
MQHRPSLAAESADPIAGSSTVSPTDFQSPATNAQPTANTAAALDNRPTSAIADVPTAAGPSHTPIPTKPKPLAPAESNYRSGSRNSSSHVQRTGGSTNSTTQSVVTVLGSLGVVLGLFFVTVWLFRGSGSKAGQFLPTEVVEPLGRTVIAKGQQLHVVRFGRKLILISNSSTGIETISEITDPVEVDRVAGLCYGKGPTSSARAFQSVLDGFAGGDATHGHDAENRRARVWRDDRLGSRGRSREDQDV